MTVDIPVEVEGKANKDKNVKKKDTGKGSEMVVTVAVVEGFSSGRSQWWEVAVVEGCGGMWREALQIWPHSEDC